MGKKGDKNQDYGNNGNMPPNKRFYKVAFSFTSGKDSVNRNFVRKVAEALIRVHEVPQELIFFDEWANLSGRANADLLLEEIYKDRSEYIVPFFSKEYLEKYWTGGVEYEPIRIVKRLYPKALIPAKLEDVNVKGFPNETIIFINCYEEKETYETVAKTIADRIKEKPPRILISDGGGGGNSNGDDNTFPFTNREKELKNILNSTDNFQLVSAPAGYGKKTFLKRLKKEYEKKKYKVYYQEISDQGVMRNRNDICRQWGYIDAQDFINTLLSGDNQKIITDKGLVLLIATENNVASDLKQLKSQIMLLRKEISTKLEANDDDYHHSDDRTKLIVSARQLFGDPINQLDWPYDFNCNNRLSEFTYQVILKSLKESDYWKLPNRNYYSSLVAKLTLMTAGHPEAVELVARNYRDNNDFDFGLVKNVIKRISNSFATSIPNKEIKDLFSSKKLPLHRYITNILLSEITKKKERKRDAILDNLYSHGLYKEINITEENDTRILKDSLLRRTCTIDSCYTDPDKFAKNLSECCVFYSNRLKDLHQPIEHSVLWLIEYWFSFLQGKLLYFNKNIKYKETIDLFNNEILKKDFLEMDYLPSNFNNKIPKFKDELINQLEKDWEFQLLLNFDTNCKTDNECYNKENYALFLNKIKIHFGNILSNDTHQ